MNLESLPVSSRGSVANARRKARAWTIPLTGMGCGEEAGGEKKHCEANDQTNPPRGTDSSSGPNLGSRGFRARNGSYTVSSERLKGIGLGNPCDDERQILMCTRVEFDEMSRAVSAVV